MVGENRNIVDKIKGAQDFLTSSRIWDLWRAHYPEFTYAEHREIWDTLYPKLKQQHCADVQWFLRSFQQLKDWGMDLSQARVVEFGSYDGWLAAECMRVFPIAGWTEMVPYAVQQTSPEAIGRGVLNIAADKPLWEMSDMGTFDIFVSSHAIEHISTEDCLALLDFVCARSQVMLVEIPTLAPGQTWDGAISSHILDLTQSQFVGAVHARWLARTIPEPLPNVTGDKAAILKLGREKVLQPRVLHRDSDLTAVLGSSLLKNPHLDPIEV